MEASILSGRTLGQHRIMDCMGRLARGTVWRAEKPAHSTERMLEESEV
jgi:hypothetical protein